MIGRIFKTGDWLCGSVAALVAFAIYAWTTAPSVTLQDSGEFLVAAQHFGVPHPTGYPLWTMLAWLFHFLPLGNVAWQTALFSGVCGALAVGLATMLIRNSVLWMCPESDRTAHAAASVCAISLALAFAFSFSMWSQSVIVEVYALHALLVGFYLTSLYFWLRRPERLAGVFWSFFFLSLAFSNHQLTLALAPLPFLVVALIRRDLFWDLFLAVSVCALLSYLAFALLSNDPEVLKAATRLTYLVATILLIALVRQRGRLHWKLIAYLPFVLALGLLAYGYLPFASSTNPPMNWGYTRTPEGFFASFNRSQYTGTLSDLSLEALSHILGVPAGSPQPDAPSFTSELREWCVFFCWQLVRSFSPLAIFFFAAALFGGWRRSLSAQAWIYVLMAAFFLAMAFQPVVAHARPDIAGWGQQMPYHTYTNFIFALLCGIGVFLIWRATAARLPRLRHSFWVLLLLPLWPLVHNVNGASQRNHWFGWKFGHDMLAGLPKGSVVFGGTDAGRFIPTYLILGESSLPPGQRVDPAFDRRDLYIITQNGLNDRYYLDYIRDQYTTMRPPVRSSFESWLGRDHAYPEVPLLLPSLEEMQETRQTAAARARAAGVTDGLEVHQAAVAETAKWIFEKNKATHAFYVEQSFPMLWSYEYAVPEGLLYRINPEPLARLPDGAAEKDLAFWTDYVAQLKSDPAFTNDGDAQKSFSELRLTGGNLYAYRHLDREAEMAFRQAIDLWSGNLDAIVDLSRILWKRGEFDESISLLNRALADDPNNSLARTARDQAVERKALQVQIGGLLWQWRTTPGNLDLLQKLITLYSQVGEEEKGDDILREAVGKVGTDPRFLYLVVQVSEAQGKWRQSFQAASRWTALQPQSPEAFYRLARALFVLGKQKESLEALGHAIDLGGVDIRERLFADPVFQSVREAPELKRLMVSPPPSNEGER